MSLDQWAFKWCIPDACLEELKASMGLYDSPIVPISGVSETAVQQAIRLEASKRGARLWRNNNGATLDADGRLIRYGLANDSKAVNEKLKSSDLIGIMPYSIVAADIGRTVGLFVSIEVKRPGWKYTGTPREEAQLAWVELIIKLGGVARFATSPGEVWPA